MSFNTTVCVVQEELSKQHKIHIILITLKMCSFTDIYHLIIIKMITERNCLEI